MVLKLGGITTHPYGQWKDPIGGEEKWSDDDGVVIHVASWAGIYLCKNSCFEFTSERGLC